MADFGIAETLAIIGAVGAGTGAAVSYNQAKQQNRAVRRSKNAAIEAASVQKGQLGDQAALEKQKRLRDLELTRARIAAAGAESGFDTSSLDFQALDRQAVTDTGINFDIIDRNLKNNKQRIDSGLKSDLLGFDSRQQNQLLASLLGGLQGGQTGLSIGNSIQRIEGPSSQTSPTFDERQSSYLG